MVAHLFDPMMYDDTVAVVAPSIQTIPGGGQSIAGGGASYTGPSTNYKASVAVLGGVAGMTSETTTQQRLGFTDDYSVDFPGGVAGTDFPLITAAHWQLTWVDGGQTVVMLTNGPITSGANDESGKPVVWRVKCRQRG